MNSTTLSPIACASWCEDGDGHADAGHAEDQYCMSESWELELTAAGGDSPDTLELYSEQIPGGPVRVRMSRNGAYSPALVLGEVERLRDELSAVLAAHKADALIAA
ncbi:hypothetical protein [Pseudarthrobacter sp. S9]|uniref:hypothetical protein n=1 Tax=Pseudarthrobacter sp. S9 TaxID=3418421 RepID=UPI003D050A48